MFYTAWVCMQFAMCNVHTIKPNAKQKCHNFHLLKREWETEKLLREYLTFSIYAKLTNDIANSEKIRFDYATKMMTNGAHHVNCNDNLCQNVSVTCIFYFMCYSNKNNFFLFIFYYFGAFYNKLRYFRSFSC